MRAFGHDSLRAMSLRAKPSGMSLRAEHGTVQRPDEQQSCHELWMGTRKSTALVSVVVGSVAF